MEQKKKYDKWTKEEDEKLLKTGKSRSYEQDLQRIRNKKFRGEMNADEAAQARKKIKKAYNENTRAENWTQKETDKLIVNGTCRTYKEDVDHINNLVATNQLTKEAGYVLKEICRQKNEEKQNTHCMQLFNKHHKISAEAQQELL